MYQISMILLCLSFCLTQVRAQKMLLLEETGKLRNTRFYVGQSLQYRLVGRENYWYTRKITDQKIKLNQRKRLLATEIRFSDQQEIPVPPEK